MQRIMIDSEPEMPDDHRIRFRLGINLGVRMIDITVGGVAQTAIFFPRHELVREVKPDDRAQPRGIASGTKRFASLTPHSPFDGHWSARPRTVPRGDY